MNLFTAVIIFLVIGWITLKLFSKKHAIDFFPGPIKLPIIGSTYPLFKPMDEVLDVLYGFSTKYFPVYRLWLGFLPVILSTDPDDIETIMSNSKYIRKGFVYEEVIGKWLGEGLLTSTGAKWFKHRKLLTPTFHFKILEQFIPVFSKKTKLLIEIFNKHVDKTEGVDVTPLITRCALDIICETAMGTDVHAQTTDSNYVKEIYELNELIAQRVRMPWLHNKLIFNLTNHGKRTKELIKSLHEFTNTVIKNRRVERKKEQKLESNDENDEFTNKRKTAFLDLLLEISEKDPSLTDVHIREEVDTFMFEGHDTTAMAMSWATYFLGVYPDVQEKCVEELREIFGDSERDPTHTDLGAMKYLEKVIKETLRLKPSVHMIFRQTESDINIGGKIIPSDTMLGINIYALNRNPQVFPNPEKFDPDRFSPENVQGRHPYVYIPFSAGPRNCIGQKFAMLEMKNLLSSLLRNFRIEAINPSKYYRAEPDIILRPKYGLPMRIYKR